MGLTNKGGVISVRGGDKSEGGGPSMKGNILTSDGRGV